MTDAKNFKIIFYDKDDCEHLVKYGAATSREFIEECIEMFKKKYDHFKSAIVIFKMCIRDRYSKARAQI